MAEMAKKLLQELGEPFATFNFEHAAAQLQCPGSAPGYLLSGLNDRLSEDDLEIEAVSDLVSVLSDACFAGALADAASEGLTLLPEHPLGKYGISDYERGIVEEEPDEAIEQSNQPNVDLESLDWDRIGAALEKPHRARREAALTLIKAARHGPLHKLSRLVRTVVRCGLKERRPDERKLGSDECHTLAAFAAIDTYRHESAVMEAADSLCRAAEADRNLERRPLYRIAAIISVMCRERRSTTVHRAAHLRQNETNKQAAEKMDSIISFVNAALYTSKGVSYFQPRLATIDVNAHGSVLNLSNGRTARHIAGKKRLAPKGSVGGAAAVRSTRR